MGFHNSLFWVKLLIVKLPNFFLKILLIFLSKFLSNFPVAEATG